jgi:hypothetical protein
MPLESGPARGAHPPAAGGQAEIDDASLRPGADFHEVRSPATPYGRGRGCLVNTGSDRIVSGRRVVTARNHCAAGHTRKLDDSSRCDRSEYP